MAKNKKNTPDIRLSTNGSKNKYQLNGKDVKINKAKSAAKKSPNHHIDKNGSIKANPDKSTSNNVDPD